MRSIVFAFLLCLHHFNVDAQVEDESPIYGELGGGISIGSYGHFKFGINGNIATKHTISVVGYGNFTDAPDAPAGFDRGLVPGSRDVQDKVLYIAAMYGRLITFDQHCRLNLRGGICVGQYRHPVNFTKTKGLLFQPTYSYETQRDFLAGILLNPTVEFTITPEWGLTLGSQICLNNRRQVAGLEVGTVFGQMIGRQRVVCGN